MCYNGGIIAAGLKGTGWKGYLFAMICIFWGGNLQKKVCIRNLLGWIYKKKIYIDTVVNDNELALKYSSKL